MTVGKVIMAAAAKHPPSYESMRAVVEQEYYNHRVVPQLEEYLKEQAATQTYDFEAHPVLCGQESL